MAKNWHLSRRLRARFTLLAVACASAIFLTIASFTLWQAHQLLLERRVQDMQNRLDGVLGRSSADLRGIRQEGLAMTDVIQLWKPVGIEPWYELMETSLRRLDKVERLQLSFLPGSVLGPAQNAFLGAEKGANGKISCRVMDRAALPLPVQLPHGGMDGFWSDPYWKDDQKSAITCNVPLVREEQGKRVQDGMVVLEASPDLLLETVCHFDLKSPFQVFMLDSKHRLITAAHKAPGAALDHSLKGWAIQHPDFFQTLLSPKHPGTPRTYVLARHPFSQENCHFFFEKLPNFPAIFVYAIPVKDIHEALWLLSGKLLLLGLAGMAGLAILMQWSAGKVTRNLDMLRQGVQCVQNGCLRQKLPAPFDNDETADVIRAFNAMVEELQAAFQRTETMARVQQRIATELELAHCIQSSLLPGPLKPLGAGLYSLTLPALEVGGDFFDHFPLPGGRTCVAVGDVSGKGISAAMFTMRASLLLRSAMVSLDLQEAVDQVNGLLSESNPQMMFVTLFVCVWDPVSQRLRYVNAGHNPPLLLRGEGGDELLQKRSGPALGALPDRCFTVWETACSKDDLLVIYTDGISEAPNAQAEQFGLSRMRDHLLSVKEVPLETCARSLLDQVIAWQGSHERFDDITLALLKVGAPAKGMKCAACLENIEPLVSWIERGAAEGGMTPPAVKEISLAVCEAVTNVILYALKENPSQYFQVFTAWVEEDFLVRIEDPGPPFNPDALPPVDTTAPLEARPVGGLGWLLIRRVTDAIRMDRVSDCNILTLIRSKHRPTLSQTR